MQTPPTADGHPASRWQLATLRTQPVFAGLRSVSGVWRRLQKLGLPYKRSRDHLHSPDPDYGPKMLAVSAARLQALATPATHVVLYADEFTFYRQPVAGYAYTTRGCGGHHQPLAQRSARSNTHRRIAGALDAVTGRVVVHQTSTFKSKELIRFLTRVRAAYGPEPAITLIWDNWPNHKLTVVTAAAADLRITLLSLPTYAPWTNPIEKLWLWLKADVLRLHAQSDAWMTLRDRVTTWLAQFAHGSFALLRYVGIDPYETAEPAWV